MALASAFRLSMSFGDTDIFSDVSFDIGAKDKIGLIGVNGAGKTTLFKLFTREYTPASGMLSLGKDTVIGYMEQHACAESERTVLNELLTVFSDVIAAEKELSEIEHRIGKQGADNAALIARQSALLALIDRRDGLTYQSRARAALRGLGFAETGFSLPCKLLSGGQRSKVSLAKLLLSGANLLLLDEPTNHLDLKSIAWLEDFISQYAGACVVISHDRYFLDKITTRIFELSHGRFFATDGNYSRHRLLREEQKKAEERVYAGAMKEIRRIEGIIEQQKRFNRERNYKTIASKQKSIDRLEKDLVRPEQADKAIRFHFTPTLTSGNDVLFAKGLSKAFGDKVLFSDVSLEIFRGERVFLTGENGCGKSTLLKMLLGRERRDSGKITLGVNVKIGYFDQTLAELSQSEKSVLDEVWDTFRQMNEVDVRRALAAFLFQGEDVFKSMRALSGGERARVALLKLMLSGSNFLVLDEPTNHLDIASGEALEAALSDFDGTLLIVSHDRYFINRLATRVLNLDSHGIESFTGGYDDFLLALEARKQNAPAQPKKAPKENTYQKQKEQNSLIRRTEGRIRRLEEEIDRADANIASLQETLNAAAADYEEILRLTNALHEATTAQEARMEEWEQLNEELESLKE